MSAEQKSLLSYTLEEHIWSIFQNYRSENKLIEVLDLGLDIIM